MNSQNNIIQATHDILSNFTVRGHNLSTKSWYNYTRSINLRVPCHSSKQSFLSWAFARFIHWGNPYEVSEVHKRNRDIIEPTTCVADVTSWAPIWLEINNFNKTHPMNKIQVTVQHREVVPTRIERDSCDFSGRKKSIQWKSDCTSY